MQGADGGGRAEMLDNTSRVNRSRGPFVIRRGDPTRSQTGMSEGADFRMGPVKNAKIQS